MTSENDCGLLTSRDAQPVRVTNRDGQALFLLLGDHAGNLVPERLADLGLAATDLERHIAVDLGVSELGAALSSLLDAPFIEQRYSRLVIDCNRDPSDPTSIAEASDRTAIPGNRGLSRTGRTDRLKTVFAPYHAAISRVLTERDNAGIATTIVSLHSFTPLLNGITRPWDVGVLHDRGATAVARSILAALRAIPSLTVGDNEPYRMDATDYTVPLHAYPASRPYVELEVRQDRLLDAVWRGQFARMLSDILPACS